MVTDVTARRRSDRGMTTRIAVSLPDDVVAAARAAVAEGRAAGVSALVSEALRAHLSGSTLSSVVAEMVAEHGEPTDADRAWAEEALAARG